MAMQKKKLFFLGLSLSSLLLHGDGQLSANYYAQSCPNLQTLVCNEVTQILAADSTMAPALIRLHFHDCFVRGCDGSVLLNSTANNTAEKAAIPNLTLRGFAQIDQIKTAVEGQCPGVVSCADILALAAQCCVAEVDGYAWDVLLGRRDGTESFASEALTNLPSPFTDQATQLISLFNSKGLSTQDLVVLSGAHSIGVGHCPTFSNRLYNFSNTSSVDPLLNPQYAQVLQGYCPPGDTTTAVTMNPEPSPRFGVQYFEGLTQNKGLFQSDASLLTFSATNSYVQSLSSPSDNGAFLCQFAASMGNMGSIGVLTGTQGEIRKICAAIN
ncbi:peroxidase 1 [Genlisea aurea]|uniref:Peroxidase n=1 Tax=Genlisea aurea TaxID=192259 RepID=S8CWJ5_9LAMI|nr:peroxidase 1 [Genlisea aurea]